jgi:hypothetical protein
MTYLGRLDRLIASLKTLDEVDLKTIQEDDLRQLVWQEVSQHSFSRIAILLNEKQIWHRGRPCDPNNPFANVAELIYPRDGSKRTGRAHIVGEPPILYASRNSATVMAEIGRSSPIHLQMIALRVKPGLICKCDVVGDFRQVNNSGLSLCGHQGSVDTISSISENNPEEYWCSLMFDSFLASRFERKVDETNEYEYRLSSLLASILMGGEGKRALMYPSVQYGGGMNIAIPSALFDLVFEVVWSAVIHARPIPFGHWIGKTVRTSQCIGADGAIHWSESPSMPPEGFVFESLASGFRKLEAGTQSSGEA